MLCEIKLTIIYGTSVLTGGRHFYCSAHAAPRQGSF
jgi:hypothetical protein